MTKSYWMYFREQLQRFTAFDRPKLPHVHRLPHVRHNTGDHRRHVHICVCVRVQLATVHCF